MLNFIGSLNVVFFNGFIFHMIWSSNLETFFDPMVITIEKMSSIVWSLLYAFWQKLALERNNTFSILCMSLFMNVAVNIKIFLIHYFV